MATRWAVQNGNWSATSTWDGGTLPTSADDVFADGRTVTIDQNITVLSLRTTQRSGGTAGGSFQLGAYSLTTTGSGIVPGTTNCVVVIGSGTSTINSNLVAVSTTSACVSFEGSGTLTINGSVNGVFGFSTPFLMQTSATGNVFINGDVFGTNYTIISSNPSGSLSITGNVTLSADLNQRYLVGLFGANASLTITGSITGQTVSTTFSQWVVYAESANSSVTVTGNVNPNNCTAGIYGRSGCRVTVTGNITGGTTSGRIGLLLDGNSSVKIHQIIGTCTATAWIGAHAVYDTNIGGGWTTVGGSLIDSAQGDCAVSTRRFRCIPTLNTVRQHANSIGFPNGTPVTYGSLDYIPNNIPAPANVRFGTVYGNNQYTGTLAVPPANAVAVGVPVDNTVGTAALSPADIAALVGAQVAAAVSSPQGP